MSNDFIAQAQERLDTLRAKHRIPGASLAILVDGQIHELASGVLNRDTGVEVTPDSLFQSGSVAKIYTATVIMRLVGEGKLDLDAKVVDVLPEFSTPDPEAAAQITIRQLLSHTGGVTNDFHGAADATGGDALARYVEAAREVPLDLPPGTAASYGSLGIVVLGRVIEVLTGTTWNQALKDLLFDPLGLKRSVTLPEEAMRYRYAWGHLGQPGTDPEPIDMFSYIPRAFAPAAQVLVSAGDLVRLAKLHLDGGVAPDGTRIVAAEAVAAMQRVESTPVDRWSVSADHWGLGWCLYDQPGFQGFGHDGSAVSQHAMLRVFPEQGVALALMTNSGNGRSLYAELFPELLDALGITMPAPFGPADPPITVDATRFYGLYQRAGVDITISERDGKPYAKYEFVDVSAEIPPLEGEMRPVSDTVFSVFMSGEGINEEMPVIFTTHNGTEYCWAGMRAAPKTA
ncbi:serine hydrolase domain-containing protein [Stackebrandtia nassauensis]|uniref:Beta-lactamase n=1 Tax=Stackebrandtia nassauensis (strain DSM 44728 / CIP 108903 / NRRL B-16338 / NBRC 102104 / LLR-40K-21) TaxID=446470 RepID=D3PX24_STANL|nr:serine hydrolase domain-containing protein [Stackebrandtia nassauensis]ADD45248.1 beta-lactamase [Stackebrandtia nassauensis DSM 44728]